MYRVILDDGRKLVGVRFPTAALTSLRTHLNEALEIQKAVVSAGGGGTIEQITPLDTKTLLKAKMAPKTIRSFFSRIPTPSSPRSTSAGSKRKSFGSTAAAAAAASGSGSSLGLAGGGGGKRSKGETLGSAASKGRGMGAAKEMAMAALFGGRAEGGERCSEVMRVKDGSDRRVVTLTEGGGKHTEIEIIEIDDD